MNPLDAVIADASGPQSLRSHMGEKGIVVYFLRDFGCHTCVHHATELGAAAAQIQANGYGVVVVGHGSADAAEKARRRSRLSVPVLADPTHSAYDAFGLDKVLGYWQKSGVFVLDPEGAKIYGEPSNSPKAGLDLADLLRNLGVDAG